MRRSVLGPGAVLSLGVTEFGRCGGGGEFGRKIRRRHGPATPWRRFAAWRVESRRRPVSLVEDDTDPTKPAQKLVTHAVKVETRVKALEVLAKIAGDNTVSMGEVKARLKRQVEVIRQTLPPEQANAVLDALAAVWR